MKTLVDAMQADAEICNARMRANMLPSEAHRQRAEDRIVRASANLNLRSKPLSHEQKIILRVMADGRERTPTDLVHKTGLQIGTIHNATGGLSARGLLTSTQYDRGRTRAFRLAGAE